MSKPTRHTTPRSRFQEVKVLRPSIRKARATTVRSAKTIKLVSSTRKFLNSTENIALNSTLALSKPPVPLLQMGKTASFRTSWLKQGLNVTGAVLNSTRNSNRAHSSSRRRPKPLKREVPAGPAAASPQQQLERLELPLSPAEALRQFQMSLTKYEQTEILNFPEVYYLGFSAPKVEATTDRNFGFDDERGDYRLFKGEHIAYRFEIVKLLGTGSFGQVCECIDHKTKDNVAVKVIKNHKKFRYQAGVEVKTLRTLRDYDESDSHNVIRLKQAFEFRKHTCLVFELLSNNLYDLLKINHFHGFSPKLVRRLALQILVGLRFIKRLRIIHCDLKPENILLKQSNKSGIKLIDFGSACFEWEKVYTYIQSRFYRAPEIILGIPYTTAIDMWSFGCILAELITGEALLQGESEAEQLQLILELRGLPPPGVMEAATRKSLFFKEDGQFVNQSVGKPLGPTEPGSRPLAKAVPIKDASFLDLLDKCLEWDPKKRITPELALGHPWITGAMAGVEDVRTHRSKTVSSSKKQIS